MNLTNVKVQKPIFLTDNILIIKKGRYTYYIDPRTEAVVAPQPPIVKPIGWNHMHLWIVCPFCQRIHQYPIMQVRHNKNTVYGNCKGRINMGIDQEEIHIDTSELIVRKE